LLTTARSMAGQPAAARSGDPALDGAIGERVASTPLSAPRRGVRWLGVGAVGGGLRLDNPYRLATPLGDSYASLSATAPYVDLLLGIATGRPTGVQQGGALAFTAALAGVAQHALRPDYIAVVRPGPRWHARARAGVPIVLDPDVTAGLEVAVAAGWYASAGLGLTAELVSSLFFGAATPERDRTLIPVVGIAVGAFADYERWP
jgi:hypothetical protein